MPTKEIGIAAISFHEICPARSASKERRDRDWGRRAWFAQPPTAAVGIGRLRVVEFDRIERSNLQRQILYSEADLSRPKLDTAVERPVRSTPQSTSILLQSSYGPKTRSNRFRAPGRSSMAVTIFRPGISSTTPRSNLASRSFRHRSCVLKVS